MTLKKLSTLLMVAVMAVSLMTGCSGSKNKNSEESNKGSNEISNEVGNEKNEGTSTEVKELTFYNSDGSKDDPWTDPVALAITDATGVKLKSSYPVSDSAQDIALMIAEQKYPDIIFAKGDISSLIDAEAIIDMTDLIEQYGPNIKKMYGEEFNKLKYSKDNSSIYQLSSYVVGGTPMKPVTPVQLQYRVLEENGYKYPTTIAEYEVMLKSYMKAHPKTDDGLDTIGLTLDVSDWRWLITLGNPSAFIAEGSPDTGEWLINKDETAIFKYRSPKVKEYFRWLGRMYDEGVLDPEFATQTHEDYIAKIGTGRVLGLTDNSWNYGEGETILKADDKFDFTYAGLPVTLDKETKSSSLMYQGLTVGWGIAITTDCKDPVAAIKFIDYICSDEGVVLRHWGIEGTNYLVDENGHRYRTEEETQRASTDQDYAKNTGVGFHVAGFPIYGDGVTDSTGSTYSTASEESIIAEYNSAERKAVEGFGVRMLRDIYPQADEFETPAYSSPATYAMSDEYNEIFKILEEIAWPALVKSVQGGQANFDATYDAMMAEFDKNNVSRAEELMTEKIKESASWKEW